MSQMRLVGFYAAVAVTLWGCSSAAPRSSSAGPRSPTDRGTSSSPGVIAAELTQSPAGCPGPLPQVHSGQAGGFFGSTPLSGGIYARLDKATGAFQASQAPRTQYGFRIKVLWVVAAHQASPVSLKGFNANTGAPILISLANISDRPSASVALDPLHPGTPSSHRGNSEFPSYLYFPSAGCYRLQADWSNGSWTMGFGFGS